MGNRSRDLPVCSAVPQPLHHRVPPCVILRAEILENGCDRIDLRYVYFILEFQWNV
jgi:hypothetical protein